MGLATAAAMLSIASGVSSIIGGMQQQAAAEEQAAYAEGTGIAQARERVRVSAKEAKLEREKTDSYRRQQKLAYLKAGVSLEGSPLYMMEKTNQTGLSNIEEITQAGAYGAAGAKMEGRQRASTYKAQGRQAFMSGLAGGAKGIGGGINSLQ